MNVFQKHIDLNNNDPLSKKVLAFLFDIAGIMRLCIVTIDYLQSL